jgi:hypothetical protein
MVSKAMACRLVVLLVAALAACAICAQDQGSAPTPNANAGQNASSKDTSAPKFLCIAHEELKAGRASAYSDLEASIVRTYNREKIAVYWLAMTSITGPAEALYLDSFESADEMSKAGETTRNALAAHPDLAAMQDRNLQENTSGETSVLAVRRDDMGYRVSTIDLSKMQVLRVSTVFAHPGYERAFREAEWSLSEASERIDAPSPWVVYQVISGLPEPTFIVLTPMESLGDLQGTLNTDKVLQEIEHGEVEEHLDELARVAFGATDTRLFSVAPKMSHVSNEFAAGDPDFWAPSLASGRPESGGTPRKPPARQSLPPSSKP